jgi:hypothetical protein
MDLDRRSVLVATLLTAVIAGCEKNGISPPLNSTTTTRRGAPDPNETFVLPRDEIAFQAWGNLPPRSGETFLMVTSTNPACTS